MSPVQSVTHVSGLYPLTTPALLSHRTPTLLGEEGDCFKKSCKPPLSRWAGVRWERGGRGSEGPGGGILRLIFTLIDQIRGNPCGSQWKKMDKNGVNC